MGRLIIDGNQVYEMDEECLRKKAQDTERNNRQQKTDDKAVAGNRQNGKQNRR